MNPSHSHIPLLVLILGLLLASISQCAITSSQDESPRLVVGKSILSNTSSPHTKTYISIDLFNVGSSPLYDVQINDTQWTSLPFSFESVTAYYPKINVGEHLTHVFWVEPLKAGEFKLQPVSVTYKSSPNSFGHLRRVFSNIPQPSKLEVIHRYQLRDVVLPYNLEWTIFGLIGIASTIHPLLIYYSVRTKLAGYGTLSNAKKNK